MEYPQDDAMAEAAAARHPRPRRGRPAPNRRPDEVPLTIRLDRRTFEALLEIRDADRGTEGFVRRLIKQEIMRRRKNPA